MKRSNRQIILAIGLIILSAAVYFIHYAVFRDVHHILIYLVGDIAFVFLEVLLVTLVIHRVLEERDRRTRLKKLNMVIGAFFSEVGTELLRKFAEFDPGIEDLRKRLHITESWSEDAFGKIGVEIRKREYGLQIDGMKLEEMRDFLVSKRGFLLRLLENPMLLEHETFTEMLRAVFHLTEELAARGDLMDLSEADRRHLGTDFGRVYERLIHEWLEYMKYLHVIHPYLFSFAMRTNPFDRTASPYVK